MNKYVIGVDFGTDSCRAVLIDTQNGEELACGISPFPKWEKGLYCNPRLSQYRHHPQDYIDALKASVRAVSGKCESGVLDNIVALSVDTTGSTPCPVDEQGVPLALLPEFSETPDAMFILWKDHTAIKEAAEISTAAKTWGGEDFTKYVGGTYSAEWFYAKMLHVSRENRRVARAAKNWVELCDWIPALLTGVTRAEDIMRSRCAAGHKALWNEEYGGLPPNEFFKAIDPILNRPEGRFFEETYTSDKCAGIITDEWARELAIPNDVKIGIGAFDCHMGAVGANITPNSIVKVMGTSTCDIMVADYDEIGDDLVEGICGQVDGSVIPGMIGLEAGQSAFGDIAAWFRELLMWPIDRLLPENKLSAAEKDAIKSIISQEVEKEAALEEPSKTSALAIDWLNGRRSPDVNLSVKGAIMNVALGTDIPQICRSLIESTAYGAKAVVDRFMESGILVDEVIAIGRVAKRSPLSMQVMADVLGMPVKVCKSELCQALGAAIFASVVGGVYPDVLAAQRKMASPYEKVYFPNEDHAEIYRELYNDYLGFGRFVEDWQKKSR